MPPLKPSQRKSLGKVIARGAARPKKSTTPTRAAVTTTKPKVTTRSSSVSLTSTDAWSIEGINFNRSPETGSSSAQTYTGPGSSPGTGGLPSRSTSQVYTGPGSSPGTGGLPAKSTTQEYTGPGSDTFNAHYGTNDSAPTQEYTGPGSDTFNAHYGTNDSAPTQEYTGPGSDTFNAHYGTSDSAPTQEYTGPGSDTFNAHYGTNDSAPTQEYTGPGSDTFNAHYGVDDAPASTPEYTGPGSSPGTGGLPDDHVSTVPENPQAAPEAPLDPDAPFVVGVGDEDNPFEHQNATEVTVTPWDGVNGQPNDSIVGILRNQGYTDEQIWAADESGQNLVNQVAAANDLDDPNIIHPDQSLIVPTTLAPTPEEAPATNDTPAPAQEYIGPGSDTFNDHYGVNDTPAPTQEYTGPGSDTFNAHYGVNDTPAPAQQYTGPGSDTFNAHYGVNDTPAPAQQYTGPGSDTFNAHYGVNDTPAPTQEYTGPGSSPGTGGLPAEEPTSSPSTRNSRGGGHFVI